MRSTNTFEEEFHERLASIESDAAELGETWTSICRGIGVSRATPDRWRTDTPLTVTLVDRMVEYLNERRRELLAAARKAPRVDPPG